MSVTVSPVVQSVTVSPVVQSVTIGTVAGGGVAQSYVDTLTDNYWDSPTLQVLIFDGNEDPASVLEYVPLNHNFSTTYGSWVGNGAPATTPVTPAAIGGSVTYVNETCVLSTNPTATVGNSRAEMRSEKPNNGPLASGATVRFYDYYWHFKADVQVTAYLPATQYIAGFYRTHTGQMIDNMVAFEERSGNWWVVVSLLAGEQFSYDTGIPVTQRCELEILHRGMDQVTVFFVNGVPLTLAGLLPFQDYVISPALPAPPVLLMHQGVAIRDDNTPQTVISSITIFSMTSKRTQSDIWTAYLLGDCQGVGSANTVAKIANNAIETGTPSESDFLIYSGGQWNHSPAGNYLDLDGLGDVVITSPIERQNLKYNGTNWVNRKDSFYGTRHTDHSISSSTAVQDVFHGSNNAFPLDANSTWLFEGSYVIGSGTTTHTTAIGFSESGGGLCNFTAISSGTSAYGTVNRTQDMTCFESSFGGPINSTTTSVLVMINFTGRITVVDATNFVPTLKFSAAPTGTCAVKSGSWIKLTRLWTGESVFADPEWV